MFRCIIDVIKDLWVEMLSIVHIGIIWTTMAKPLKTELWKANKLMETKTVKGLGKNKVVKL